MRRAKLSISSLTQMLPVLGALVAFPAWGDAQTVSTFTGTTGSWNNADNWSSANYPSNGQPTAGSTYSAVLNSGNAQLNGNFEIEALTLNGGSITAATSATPRALEVNELFLWQAGALRGNVTLNLNNGIQISGATGKTMDVTNISGPAYYIPTINHSGTGSWSGGSVAGTGVASGSNDNENTVYWGTLNNLSDGTFNVTAAGYAFRMKLINEGVINANPGEGNTVTLAQLRNDGVVNVQSGTLAVTSTYQYTAAGDFVLSGGSTVHFSSYTLQAASSVTGAGNVIFSAANTVAGEFDIGGSLTLQGANQTWSSNLRAGALIVDSSSSSEFDVFGPGNLTATGRSTWKQGQIGGDVVLNLAGGLDIVAASADAIPGISDNAVLNIMGPSTWTGTRTNFQVTGDAQFNVKSGGTLTVQGTRVITAPFENDAGAYSFEGTVVVETGATLAVTSVITGSSVGTMVLRGDMSGVRIDGGELRMEGGTSTGGLMTAGTITGTGRIRGRVDGSQIVVSPGSESQPIGQLFMHDLKLGNQSKLTMQIGGRLLSEYDRIVNDDTGVLAADGELTLGGELAIFLINGFGSLVGGADTFEIMRASLLIDGAFTNISPGQRLITADGFGSFVVNYGVGSAFGSNRVVLSNFVAIPEPNYGVVIAGVILGFVVHARFRRRAEKQVR